MGRALTGAGTLKNRRGRHAEQGAVPHAPRLSEPGIRRAGRASHGARHMAIALDLGVQFVQMLLVLAAAPLLTGYVRKAKAHLLPRQGPPLLQPYRDLIRLLRKDVV